MFTATANLMLPSTVTGSFPRPRWFDVSMFGRQGCNREIAFYKASAIAQSCNIVRRELGLPTTYIPAADPVLQTDVVPGRDTPVARAAVQ